MLARAACGPLALAAAAAAAALLRRVWYYRLRPPTSFDAHRGHWAVITGASRGVGRGFALALARRGLNVVLVARDAKRLEAVAAECEAFGVRARCVPADLSDAAARLRAVRAVRKEGFVAVLVNNVGGRPPPSLQSAPNPCCAEYLDARTHASYFQFNCQVACEFVEALLGPMVQQDHGYVLNVGSLNGQAPTPLLAAYSAAKAYVFTWSEALRIELAQRGSHVLVECVCPGPLATEATGAAESAHAPDPAVFAEQTLRLAGTRYVTNPWPRHRWMLFLYGNTLPQQLAERWRFKQVSPSW